MVGGYNAGMSNEEAEDQPVGSGSPFTLPSLGAIADLRGAKLAATVSGEPLHLSKLAGALTTDLSAAYPKLDPLRLSKLFGDFTGGISAELVEGWRGTLLAGQDAARLSVAGSMAGLIADKNLTALSATNAQFGLPGLAGENLSRAITEATSSYMSGIGKAVRDGLIASIRPAALAATSSLMERIKASSEQQRIYEEDLWQMGWWMLPSASTSFFWDVGRLAHEGERLALRRKMTAAARSREFGRIVESWMDLAPFRRRRRFIRDGLQDHLRGRYRVSIPTLLPQIEGIAIEAFAPGSTDTNPKGVIKNAVATYDAVMGPAIVEAVTILWARQDFGVVAPGSRRLNRQLVLHGRSTGYATEENSAKVLFAFDLLASLVEDAKRHPERSRES